MDGGPLFCAVFSFFSASFMIGLYLISSELENPFGEDPNDLPCFSMQREVNRKLLVMLDPAVWRIPGLLDSACDYNTMAQQNPAGRLSLQQYYNSNQTQTQG